MIHFPTPLLCTVAMLFVFQALLYLYLSMRTALAFPQLRLSAASHLLQLYIALGMSIVSFDVGQGIFSLENLGFRQKPKCASLQNNVYR